MKNYSFVVDDRAKDEIISAYLWYEEKQIGLGEKFMSALKSCFDYIASNPKMYKKI